MNSMNLRNNWFLVPKSLDRLRQPIDDTFLCLFSAFTRQHDDNFEMLGKVVLSLQGIYLGLFVLLEKGLGGDPSLVDLGGVPYLVPSAQRDRIYDLAELPAMMDVRDGSVLMIGAGAGPWQHLGTNCEMMANLCLSLDPGGKKVNGTRLATVDPAGQRQLHVLPPEQTRCSLLSNLLVSHGLPGTPVLRVRCQKRSGPDNFVTCMRKAVRQRYADQPVGQL